MTDINNWLSEIAILHQKLKPRDWPIRRVSERERKRMEITIRTCFHNQRVWIQQTDVNVREELSTDNWSVLVENIRDGIEDSLTTILTEYRTPESKLPVMIDRYRLPAAALEISQAMLAITEQMQRMKCLLSYVLNQTPSTPVATVQNSGTRIRDELKQLEDNSTDISRNIVTIHTNGSEANVSVLSAVAKDSMTCWTEQDLQEYLSSEESNVRMTNYKGSIIGFVLYKVFDDHVTVEEPICDIGFDTTEMKVSMLLPLRVLFTNNRTEMRFTAPVESTSLLELLEFCGFIRDGEDSIVGFDTITHVMRKGVNAQAGIKEMQKRNIAAGIVHIVNHRDWNIVEPAGFQI